MSRRDWTLDEHDALQAGIEGGLSWSEIAARLPCRKLHSIQVQAWKTGLARKMVGAWPQIPDDENFPIITDLDPLLKALVREHSALKPAPAIGMPGRAAWTRRVNAAQTGAEV